MKNYVAGFVFLNESHEGVLLVEKLKPDFMVGKLNGIGGEIDPDEMPMQAMVREFDEETEIQLPGGWSEFACIRRPSAVIHCFRIQHQPAALAASKKKNDIGEQMMIADWSDPDVIALMFDDVHLLLQLACLKPTRPVDIYLEDIE